MVDYFECIESVTTLTIIPKPGGGGRAPTPAILELKVDKGLQN